MSKIRLYTTDNNIEDDDKVVGTDVNGNYTKNYEMSAIRSYVGSSSFVTKEVTITSEQLLSLGGGGTIELIEAPGSGKVIVPVSICSFLDFNTTAYVASALLPGSSGNDTINLMSGTTGTLDSISNSIIQSGSDVYFIFDLAGVELEVNGNINLTANQSFSLSAGDSDLIMSISYRIADFS